MKRVAFFLMCVCLAVSMPSLADETIVYQNDYNDETPGSDFSAWDWLDGDIGTHTSTYEDDGTGNIVVDHNGTIDNSEGVEDVNTRFGSQWDIDVSGNTSSEPADYIIEFDINSVSGNWDPIALEFFVITSGNGYGSGPADYNQADGWVHVEMSLADLPVPWWQGTNWDLTSSVWSIEVGGPPWPGTTVTAGTPAWNQIWQMDNLKITQIREPTKSQDPDPQNGATYVNVNPTLGWTPGVNADKHDIYLGTDFNNVSDANRDNPMNVLVEQDYSGNTYGPDTLQFSTTYYWRIDDVNDPNIYKGDVWSFTTSQEFVTEIIVYQNDYNNETPGNGFPAWNWANGTTTHAATYQDDGTGNIVVDHNGTIDNSEGTEASNCRFGSKWDITVSGNISSDPGAYTIEFDLRSVSGEWDPISLEFFVLTYNPAEGADTYGYGSGGSYYAIDDGWVHIEINLSELATTWWQGTNWDLTYPTWSIEVGGPPYPGTSVPAGTPPWNQIWQMDNLMITEYVGATSYDPFPPNGATRVKTDIISSWTPGIYAVTHDIYLGTDLDNVSDANRGNPLDVLVAQDNIGNTYEPNNFQFNTTYYWRVDDVNDPNIYKGEVWSFTTRDRSVIDDFDFYSDTGKVFKGEGGPEVPQPRTLKSVWIDGNYAFEPYVSTGTSGSIIQLNTDTNDCHPYSSYYPDCPHYTSDDNDIYLSEEQSMKFYYDNDGTVNWEDELYGRFESFYIYTPTNPYISEIYAAIDDDAQEDEDLDSLDLLRDWSGYNVLDIPFYGDPGNDAEPMYVSLEDSNSHVATVSSNQDLTKRWWQDWYIAMSEFTTANGDLELEYIVKIHIGFGNKSEPSAGGSGVVFFDDIRLSEGICIPGSLPGDFDNDCVVNNIDLEIFTYGFPGEMPTMSTPIIELNAAPLSFGPLSSWSNTGSEGGTFVDVNAADGNDPVVETVDGKKCVTFDNLDMLVWDQNAPATITSDTNAPNDFTVIYDVYNPEIANEEILFAWAQRGGPAATCASVGYGSNAAWAAVVHWNAGGLEPDMGFDRGVPTANQWHIIGVTYDGKTEALAVDGAIHNLEDKDLAIYMDQPATIGAAFEPADPDAAYIRGTFVPTYGLRYIASVASIKVYAEAIPPGDLAILTASLAGLPKAETDVKPDGKIDFGDIAVMGYKWMEDPYLFGKDY